MKAAVLTEFGQPLEIADVVVPSPAADEALVRVAATGICGTDLKITSGAFTTTPLPIIPGHEVAGTLTHDIEGLRKGQRVACYLYDPCGECRWCRAGEFTLCPKSRRLGFERDGGLAEFVAVPRRNLIPFSEMLSFEAAAVCMDAVTSPWRALVTRARVQPGEFVVVSGAGGLGLSGIQIARAAGARVAVIDPADSHRALALEDGAEVAVDASELDRIRTWAPDGADVGFEASGTRAGFDSIVSCMRPGGRVVCCGYKPGLEYGLDSSILVLNEITIMGSRAGSLNDARAALRALEEGVVKPRIMERLGLQDANRALDMLRAGSVLGRVVVVQ
jgi:D-arabinose 1-dehydrogenase-like Zn-dependent alcohol dehydrogenase